jgi:hypothetical protein
MIIDMGTNILTHMYLKHLLIPRVMLNHLFLPHPPPSIEIAVAPTHARTHTHTRKFIVSLIRCPNRTGYRIRQNRTWLQGNNSVNNNRITNKFRITKTHVHYKNYQILIGDIVNHSVNTSTITITTIHSL